MVLHRTRSTGRLISAPATSNSSTSIATLAPAARLIAGWTADDDRDFEVLLARRAALQVLPDVAAGMQAGAETVGAFELKALIAEVAHAGVGVLAHQDAGTDVASRVLLVVAADRQQAHVGLGAALHHLLARRRIDKHGLKLMFQRMGPGGVELAAGRAGHSSDAVAVGEQIGDDRHAARGRIEAHHRMALARIELEDQRGLRVVELIEAVDAQQLVLGQLLEEGAQRRRRRFGNGRVSAHQDFTPAHGTQWCAGTGGSAPERFILLYKDAESCRTNPPIPVQ